jgi:hypothetical protein
MLGKMSFGTDRITNLIPNQREGIHITYAGTRAPIEVMKVLYSPNVMDRSLFIASSMDLLSRLSDPSSSSPMSNSVEFVMYFFHARKSISPEIYITLIYLTNMNTHSPFGELPMI